LHPRRRLAFRERGGRRADRGRGSPRGDGGRRRPLPARHPRRRGGAPPGRAFPRPLTPGAGGCSRVAMLAVGMKIVHRAQPSWGIGVVLRVREGGRFLEVRFPGRPGSSFLVSAKDPALARYTYGPGEEVQLLDGSRAHIVRVIEGGPDTLYRYEIDGAKKEISELEIVPVPPAGGALGMLSAGTGASPELHALRRSAVRLD